MSKHTPEQRCCANVFHDNWPKAYPCSRNGKVQRDGKWYCKQHDPETRKALAAASYEKYRNDMDAKLAREQHKTDCVNALAGRDPAKLEALEKAVDRLMADGPFLRTDFPSSTLNAYSALRSALAAFRKEAQ